MKPQKKNIIALKIKQHRKRIRYRLYHLFPAQPEIYDPLAHFRNYSVRIRYLFHNLAELHRLSIYTVTTENYILVKWDVFAVSTSEEQEQGLKTFRFLLLKPFVSLHGGLIIGVP